MNKGEIFKMTKEEFQEQIEVGSIVCSKKEYEGAKKEGREPILEQVYMSKYFGRKLCWQIDTHCCTGDYIAGREYYFLGVEPLRWKKTWEGEILP